MPVCSHNSRLPRRGPQPVSVDNPILVTFQEEEKTGENVRVVVRVRPLDGNERQEGCQNVVAVDKVSRAITVLKPNAGPAEPPKVYYFDNVFDEDSSQVRPLFNIIIVTIIIIVPVWTYRFNKPSVIIIHRVQLSLGVRTVASDGWLAGWVVDLEFSLSLNLIREMIHYRVSACLLVA